jgi:hypothetical protein
MHLPDGIGSVYRLARDTELAAGLEKVDQHAPDEFTVVDDQD